MARRYVSQRGKTYRAYAVHIQLVETSEWWRALLSRHYTQFNLTWMEYRVLEELYRNGPRHQQEISRRFDCSKQNIRWVIRRLASRGWLRLTEARLPAGNVPESRWMLGCWVKDYGAWQSVPESIAKRAAKQTKEREPKGRRIVRVALTEDGTRKFSYMIWLYAKYIKSEMRVLDGREQMTLCRLLWKLKRGDPIKFYKDFRMWDRAEWKVAKQYVKKD